MILVNNWRRKRTVAHWILKQFFNDTNDGPNIVDLNNKIIGIDGPGTFGKFELREANLKELQNLTKRYTIIEISNAVTLLIANKHVEYLEKTSLRDKGIFVIPTVQGRVAYEDLYYINQRKDNWHRDITNVSNWLTPIMTFIVAFIALLISIIYGKRPNTESTHSIERVITTPTKAK